MSTVPDHFVLVMDAAARLAIHIINHANSPLIAQCGDLSHDKYRGGFNSRDGRVHVSKDASFMKALSNCWQSTSPMTTSYAPRLSQGGQPHSTNTPILPSVTDPVLPDPSTSTVPIGYKEIPAVRHLSPYEITSLLSYLTGQYDVIYLCRALGLDQKDYDTITDGSFIRAAADNRIVLPIGWNQFYILDSHGSFVRANILFQNSVFELKVFNFIDRPGLYPFLFKPEHPGVWFNTSNGLAPSGDIVLDTCIHNVLNSSLSANAWLNDAGDIAKIIWETFYGHTVFYVWHSNDSNVFQRRNAFAAALHFVSEAKKHGIPVQILDVSNNSLLDLANMFDLAERFNVEPPHNLGKTSIFDRDYYNNEYFNQNS